MSEEIFLAEVLDPDQTFLGIVKIDFRRANAVRFEKLRDLDVMPVFLTLEIIFYQDERLIRRRAHAVKFSVRPTFLNRRDVYVVDIEMRNACPRLAKQEIGLHDQMSMLWCVPLTFFRVRTIQEESSLREAICAPGHKIVSSRTAPAPTRQSADTTEHPRICALGSPCALFAIGSAQSGVFT